MSPAKRGEANSAPPGGTRQGRTASFPRRRPRFGPHTWFPARVRSGHCGRRLQRAAPVPPGHLLRLPPLPPSRRGRAARGHPDQAGSGARRRRLRRHRGSRGPGAAVSSSRSIRATPASGCSRASGESTARPSPPPTAPSGSWWPTTDDALGDRAAVERLLRLALRPGLALEIWDERHLLRLLGERFGSRSTRWVRTTSSPSETRSTTPRDVHAFERGFQNDPLQAALLWHLAFWRVRQLREAGRSLPRSILPPGLCRDVVVLMADLCSYSSYVRDTRDIARQSRNGHADDDVRTGRAADQGG